MARCTFGEGRTVEDFSEGVVVLIGNADSLPFVFLQSQRQAFDGGFVVDIDHQLDYFSSCCQKFGEEAFNDL